MDQGRSKVYVEDGQEEDHMDCQANKKKQDHPHFERQDWTGSEKQL